MKHPSYNICANRRPCFKYRVRLPSYNRTTDPLPGDVIENLNHECQVESIEEQQKLEITDLLPKLVLLFS